MSYFSASEGTPETITFEADQRRVHPLMTQYGLTEKGRAKVVPGDRTSFVTKNLLAWLTTGLQLPRSACMRCLFPALDRLDIQSATKEVSQTMSAPTVNLDEDTAARGDTVLGWSPTGDLDVPTPGMAWEDLGYDRKQWGGILGHEAVHVCDVLGIRNTSRVHAELDAKSRDGQHSMQRLALTTWCRESVSRPLPRPVATTCNCEETARDQNCGQGGTKANIPVESVWRLFLFSSRRRFCHRQCHSFFVVALKLRSGRSVHLEEIH